ncbi:MAG: 30S ribosomal protein S6 [Candidatus Pacebacteria bacterium]|nr:30S ribosomal protein S6 [Candidatus Paceibacterota bacterium]
MSEKVIYEIGYLVIPNVSDEEVLTEVANIKLILEKEGATFLSGDEPKLIDLAYPVSKIFNTEKQIFEKAYFAWIKFEVEVDKLVKIKAELDKYENILRYLLIKALKESALISDNKKPSFTKKDEIIEEKQIKPVEIIKKEDSSETDIKKVEDVNDAEKEKSKEELDETIDNLIIK